jgi:hypothetical protein
MLVELLELIALHDNNCVLLINLLLVLDLLIVGKEERPFKLCVELSHLLVDAQDDFLLSHDLDRLHAVDFLLFDWQKSSGIIRAPSAIFLAALFFTCSFLLLIPGRRLVFFLLDSEAESW